MLLLLLLFTFTFTFNAIPARRTLLFNTTHGPRTPKHGGLYRYGRGHGRHSLLLHRPLIGEESEGGSATPPSTVTR